MDRERYLRSRLGRLLESVAYFAAVGGVLLAAASVVLGAAALPWLGVLAVAVGITAARIPLPLILRSQGARPLHVFEAPGLFDLVRSLSRRASLAEVPALYLLPSPQPQAFAVSSSDQSAITVSTGLLRMLGPRELAGVLAHELSHLKNGDTRVLMAARWMAQMTRSLSTVGFLGAFLGLLLVPGGLVSPFGLMVLLVAPTLGGLAFLALSRAREFDVDASGAALTGDPRALASALSKMERFERSLLARLLPFPVPDAVIPEAYRTHPNTRERVRRLLDLTPPAPPRRMALPPLALRHRPRFF